MTVPVTACIAVLPILGTAAELDCIARAQPAHFNPL